MLCAKHILIRFTQYVHTFNGKSRTFSKEWGAHMKISQNSENCTKKNFLTEFIVSFTW